MLFRSELAHLAEALSKAQAHIEGAKEDATNPFFKSKYADLSSVWNACKKALSSHGLSVVQTVENGGEKVYLVTMLLHSSGQWIRSYMPILATKQDPQAFGSAMTYCRRYALAAMVGVCPADDDAETAMNVARKPTPASPMSKGIISQTQVDEIKKLLFGRDELQQKLLDWAQIADIEDLPLSKYAGAMKAIENHLAKEAVS